MRLSVSRAIYPATKQTNLNPKYTTAGCMANNSMNIVRGRSA